MKRLLFIILALCALLVLFSCGSEYNKDYVYDGVSLIGKWQESSLDENYYQTYEFFENGSVVCSSYSYGIWLQSIEGQYRIEGKNTIILTYADGIINENRFSINEGKRLVIQTVDGVEAQELILVPYEPIFNLTNPIVGSWVSTDNENEVFTYNEDFTGKIYNEKNEYIFDYAVKDSYLYMSYEFIEGFHQGISITKFEINGNILTLSGNTEDEQIILTFERQ